MKKILIIGENSYIGTSFTNYILENYNDYTIDCVDSKNNKWKDISFSPYDVVYNVSGLCHADAKQGTEEMYYAINTDLPIELAKKAKADGVKQFIQMSSMIVYGNMSRIGVQKNIFRDTPPEPVNVYGQSKLNAEKGLNELKDDSFKVAIIRPPLIYGENAKDNFPRLIGFAKKFPIFPDIDNSQSMIYIDNFCELIRLIVENEDSGVFFPQDREYIMTSQLVKDVSVLSANRLHLTKIFNPILKLISHKIYFVNKVFGNITYDKSASDHYNFDYCVVNYETALNRIVNKHLNNELTN